MYLALVINSIVCVVGTIAGAMFAMGSSISIANMHVPWAPLLLIAAVLVPVMFVVSGIGAWLAYTWSFTRITTGMIALPWAYGLLFVLAMLMSFER